MTFNRIFAFSVLTFMMVSCLKEDTTPPVIKLNGKPTVYADLNAQYVDSGATAYDDEDGDLTEYLLMDNNVNNSMVGKYSVIYTVTDNSGNTAMRRRFVVIQGDTSFVDTIPPVLTLIGPNPLNMPLFGTYDEHGASAYDNVSGNITGRITISGTVNTSVAGDNTLTYTVFDDAGNNTVAKRTVHVGY